MKCEKCGKEIKKGNEAALELSETDGRYYPPGGLPKNHNTQGAFVFGKDCAKKSIFKNVSSYLYA